MVLFCVIVQFKTVQIVILIDMKIIYHEDYENSEYASNPAASEGRIRTIKEEIQRTHDFDFLNPEPAERGDLKLVHTNAHIEKIKKRGELLFQMASLAAGGAIKAGEVAYEGESAFGLIRPPGHHASPNSAWGFCYFNNTAIAIKKLMKEEKVTTAYILDFDLHTGDGNINALGGNSDIEILNPKAGEREDYLAEISESLNETTGFDIIGVSAGFDEHVDDWGGKLTTSDYQEIGSMIKDFSLSGCDGRRFAVLEGGYNHKVLGKNVASFLEGFKD